MSDAPRVLVSGYYGFGNAGDEAILAGLVEGFRRLAPEVRLTVLSGDPGATEAEHAVRAIPRGLVTARSALGSCDLLLSGGGGILQDVTSWRSPLYYLAVLQAAQRAGVPVACVGYGVGPLRRQAIRWLARRALARVAVLAVRDRLSLAALRELGVRREIALTADLAFALPRPAPEEVAAAWERVGLGAPGQPTLGVALRRVPGGAGPQAELSRSLTEAIRDAAQELSLRPVLVPMQPSEDLPLAQELADAIGRGAQVVRVPLSARELLALFGGASLVLAMRLHAAVFAAICGRPLAAISYDPKVDGLLAELGLEAAVRLPNLDPAALRAGLREAAARPPSTWAARVEGLRERALANVRLVLPLISAL